MCRRTFGGSFQRQKTHTRRSLFNPTHKGLQGNSQRAITNVLLYLNLVRVSGGWSVFLQAGLRRWLNCNFFCLGLLDN